MTTAETLTEAEILDAIRQDKFVYFYQPKISLITGKVYGAEALIRLVTPEGRILMPEAFIPVAERSSLIRELTRHMFPRLVRDVQVMQEVDRLTFSFNTSVKDFEDDVFSQQVLQTLEQTRLSAESLQVELTETATLESGERIKTNILPLVDAGLGLAMDDFAKGYSSLDTLSKWPFSTIKLDQGLIGRMFDSDKSLTIVETSIRMAHELGVNVIAEGVEKQEQYQRLLEAGCTKVQGYWVSKPLPMDQYISFVKENFHWSGLPVGLIHMAIIDHVQWRRRLVSELVKGASSRKDAPERKSLDIPPLSSKECKLGHWYNGVGRMFQDRKSFQKLDQPHFELHETGTKLVEMVAHGAEVHEIQALLFDLAEHSMQMLNLLHALEFEGMMDMHAAHDNWAAHSLNPANLITDAIGLSPLPSGA